MPALLKQWQAAKTGLEAARSLYHWLTKIGVVDQLNAWREAASAAGELARSRAHEQAWTTFTALLDDYVTILGNAKFNREQFHELLYCRLCQCDLHTDSGDT